jgi:5-hydroxyisourate hydrolase
VSLSTHVLDNASGMPAPGVPVRLERVSAEPGAGWVAVAAGVTDGDGRLRDWVPDDQWGAGTYRLVFDTAAYLGPDAFFPEATITFTISEPERHHHVPLLLSPYAYTTYRGS